MPAWGVIAAKDLRLLWRDRGALFWVVAFPLVFAGFFGSVMRADVESTTAPIPVVVVESGAAAPEAATVLERVALVLAGGGMLVTRAGDGAARDAVRRGVAVGFVNVREGSGSTLVLGIDPSRRTEAALLRTVLAAVAGAPAAGAGPPLEVTEVARLHQGPRSGYEVVFPAMILWGLLGCTATFAVGMVAERTTCTLLRMRAAPIRRAAILGGKAGACAIAGILDAALLSAIGWLILGVHIDDALKFAAAVGATVVCFVGLTMALSTLGRTEQSVAGAGWATLVVMAMLGGAMVPLALFPEWMLSLSALSPVKWGILALEGATWRSFAWAELALPLGILMSVGLLGFGAGVAVLVAYTREP